MLHMFLHQTSTSPSYSKGSSEVTRLLQGDDGIKEWVEAKFVVDTDIESLGDKMIACIEAKRAALGI